MKSKANKTNKKEKFKYLKKKHVLGIVFSIVLLLLLDMSIIND